MTFVHGKDTFISLDGNDLSAFTNASEMGRGRTSHNIMAYGGATEIFQSGAKTHSLSMSGIYDNTATGPRDVIVPIWDVGDAVTLIRRTEGTGSGLPQDSISVIVTNYVETNPVGDMVAWSCEMQPAGDMTSSDQA